MAYKYREDLVGKRFLYVSGVAKINVNKVSEWGWKAGVIRAASLKDNKNKELQVLVEYDGADWQRREWVPVYSRRTFKVFLVERTLVWAPRKHEGEDVKWPALTFSSLAADVTLQPDAQPIEFLHDKRLDFLDYTKLQPFQDWDPHLAGSDTGAADTDLLTALSSEAAEWRTFQDGQRILTTTPTVLGGCRAQVYRVAGATQWYTAVIVGVNEHTGELTVTDDTVLEEHSEDPSLVQMRLLGDGVIESIMRGEVVGVMPRRSRSNLQRVDREPIKSPATAGGRKKAAAVRSNGQIAPTEPPAESRTESPAESDSKDNAKKGVTNSVGASVVVNNEQEKCDKTVESVSELSRTECLVGAESASVCGASAECEVVSVRSADGVGSAVASEEDDCVIVCARDADERSDSGVSGVRSGGSASSVDERDWRAMAHGYGGGPPPPLLHLPPPPPPALYATELLWKQRYQPPLHAPLHHAIADDYLAAAAHNYDRERHERLLRERREQEQQRELLEKQQKEKERERMEREREREREKQEREREEKERQENAASKLVSRHFEESLRLANQKRERSMSWSLINSLAPNARAEHERARERAYYAASAANVANSVGRGPAVSPRAPSKQPSYQPYRSHEHAGSVIVKHDAKQMHAYPPPAAPAPVAPPANKHYLPARPYREAPADKRRAHPPQQALHPGHAHPPPRHQHYYAGAPPPPQPAAKLSPHMYAHAAGKLSPAPKAEPPPVPYPPPSAYSPAPRGRPHPPAAHHHRTPPPTLSNPHHPHPHHSTPPPRAHGDMEPTPQPLPEQLQPLDLAAASRPPEPRKRVPPEAGDAEAKRRRVDSPPVSVQPLIAHAATGARPPLGLEPAPPAPGPPCDVRVPSADGSVETPEKAAGASPAPRTPPPANNPTPASSPPIASNPPASVATAAPTVRHLKKAWLQRHETAPIPESDSGGGGVCVTLPMSITREPDEPSEPVAAVLPSVVVPCAADSLPRRKKEKIKPRKPKENGRIDDAEEDTSSSDRDDLASKRKPPKAKRKKGAVRKVAAAADEKKKKASSGSESDKESDDKESDSGASGSGSNSSRRGASGAGRGSTRRGRAGRGAGRGARRDPPPNTNAPAKPKPTRPTDSFLQNGPCCEVAPRLAKCRECRWTPAQRDKDMPNIFCRFFAFRRLKYAKNRQLAIAGFSDPFKDAEEEDKKLWLSSSAGAAELDIEMSCFLLKEIGDQFCELLQQENEAETHHQNEDKTVAWKRVVQGVREMCDVCETTLFNLHWTCGKCGFVVCLDCYKSRTSGEANNQNTESNNTSSGTTDDRDSCGWLTCTSGGTGSNGSGAAHSPRRLLLTQIAAGGALAAAAARLHAARADWALPACASCPAGNTTCPAGNTTSPAGNATRAAAARALLLHAIQKNIKKEDDKEEKPTNGSSPVKSENGKTSTSIVSWLSDLPLKTEAKQDKSDTSSSDSEEGGNFSTLRELLIRPAPDGGDAQPKKKQKKNKNDLLDDVISSVVDEKKDESTEGEEKKPFALSDVVKRYGGVGGRGGRDALPVRIMTLTESRLLYPDVPHAWLCDGKLLHLTDPSHPGNYKLFQDQWKRGQPVLVSDVSSLLDKDLWTPESFSRDFGDTRVDLVNCASGLVVPNQPGRKFWDGFELAAKRLRDERGAPMVLKLKDWPPGEDFAELLPTRFDDLMRSLPLSEYTARNGRLNLAARLPECFVRPDLGPKMYTAYGGAGGTTNLHLDVSDAVNVMVHASAPQDAPERAREAARAADEAGVDVLTRRRARLHPPAALWHIYAARDADKIRDLLVRAELERGARPRPQHDPLHDQTWYLDAALRDRLYREYGVEGYAIVQCPGDAVFVPAGAPHQVRNLLDCIKVAEDFVSPENVSRCFELAQQFRRLSHHHANKEDKLQIKNIVYHAVKDSLCCLEAALGDA